MVTFNANMACPTVRDRSSSVSSPATAVTTPDLVSADDDIWASDHENDPATSSEGHAQGENLLSDLPTVKRQHMTDGYREGLGIGKVRVMQQGFDDGYPIGVKIALRAGKVLGCIEGVLAAKDISGEQKASIRKTYEQARSELAFTSLFKDMDDQLIMENKSIPTSIETVLKRWESATVAATLSEDAA